jgi:CRP-like cAMP-binding protein/glyoxylase-like metal-dependent hydrolase (beta-lactamase superfamily II)
MTSQRVFKLQNNAVVVKTTAGDVLVNSPPEILKFLLANGFSVPKIILLPPDVLIGERVGSCGFVHQGINYASVEFLLYANFFVYGGQKTKIITATNFQGQRLSKILQETIIGPKDKEEYFPHPWVQRECRSLSYIQENHRPLELDDLVIFASLEMDGGRLDDHTEIVRQDNQYTFLEDEIEFTTVSTTITETPLPLVLTPPQPVLRQEISLQFIGGSDGYDPEGITTCFLAYLGTTGRDNATLFDAAAYLRVRLGNLGISPAQISEVVISHLHEDHIAGLPELLLGGGRIRLVTAKVIYRSLLRVLSAMLAIAEEEVARLFDYFPLEPGQPLILEGKRFQAIYAIHTIPTIAVRVDGLCYSGDMRYDEVWFDQLVKDGILSKTRRGELVQFAKGAQILIQDAGGGTIHTTLTPEVLSTLAAKSKHIILTHTRKDHHRIPDSLSTWGNIEFAEDGHLETKKGEIPVDPMIEKLETISTCPLYARLSISSRLGLADAVEIKNWEPDQIILQEGEPSDSRTYIVHKGLVKTLIRGTLIQVLGRGHSIGEQGALTLEPRVVTISAYGPTQLLVLNPEVFTSVAKTLGLHMVYRRVEYLWSHPLFKHLPWSTLLDLALDFQPLFLPTGRLLYEYGKPGNECYLLVSGEITLLDKNLKFIGSFDTSGEFFGGRSLLLGTSRNTYACVSQESEIWALPAGALQRLQMLYPSVILHLRSVAMRRSGQAPFISALPIP